jgi:hypothetical protein
MRVEMTRMNAHSMAGIREESAMRELLLGSEKKDLTELIDRSFCALVGVGEEEEPSLWFGKVLGLRMGGGRGLLTTVGEFRLIQGTWKLVLTNGNLGATTEFVFTEAK